MAALPAVIVPESRYERAEVVDTIRQTVAKGATDAQLRMFLEVCKRTGLDPFLKEIWYVAEKGIIMAGRDGYLRVANESPQFDGMETRVQRDAQNMPIKAVCSVWRKDRSHAITCEAYYSEYAKTSPVWRQYPSAMISKVAEVLALKRSFSINGVVTEEEIGGEERGSKAAAAAVAEAKLQAMRLPPVVEQVQPAAPQPAARLIEGLPEPEWDEEPTPYELIDELEPETDIERELRESIILTESRKNPNRPLPNRFDMLRAFGEIKTRYARINMEHTYYGYLAQHGLQHSNQFTDLAEARACYKQMSLDVQNREVRGGPRRMP